MIPKKNKQEKKTKRGRKPYIRIDCIEQLYKIVNKIQTEESVICMFFSNQSDNFMAENIFKDAEITYKIVESPKGAVFKLFPSKREIPDIDISVDFFDDEQIEEGELF
jgi:hypothetical protein